jgi:hypothetical protein
MIVRSTDGRSYLFSSFRVDPEAGEVTDDALAQAGNGECRLFDFLVKRGDIEVLPSIALAEVEPDEMSDEESTDDPDE